MRIDLSHLTDEQRKERRRLQQRAATQRWLARHPGAYAAYKKSPQGIAKRRAWEKRYYVEHPDKRLKRNQQSVARARVNPAIKARQSQWHKDNPDAVRAADARYRAKPDFKAKNRDKMRKWRAKNPERSREICRQSHARNPENKRALRWKRNARLKEITVRPDLIAKFMQILRKRKFLVCYYCKARLRRGPFQYHIDHVLAIDKGGLHSADNLCVACPTCNMRKQNKLLSEIHHISAQPVLPI